jgi:hypothetical protein
MINLSYFVTFEGTEAILLNTSREAGSLLTPLGKDKSYFEQVEGM